MLKPPRFQFCLLYNQYIDFTTWDEFFIDLSYFLTMNGSDKYFPSILRKSQ